MGEDSRVSKLVELIFQSEIPDLSEIDYVYSFLPACMLTRLFSQSMRIVLKTKYIIICNRFLKFIDTCYYKMFKSHEMYITYLMYACHAEHTYNLKVFDSFIGICTLLVFLSDQTKSQTEMDFSNLNVDIFMVFYRDNMHKLFRKAGGLKKFAKYIINHEYLEPFDNVLTVCADTCTVRVCVEDLLDEFIFDLDVVENDTLRSLAKKVLLKTSVELPTLISMQELIAKRIVYCRIEMAKKDEQKTRMEEVLDSELYRKVLEKSLNTNGDSKNNQEIAQRVNNKEKKFVQAVMTSNSDSETNLIAVQKRKQKENSFQGIKTYSTDSETDLGSKHKGGNTRRKNFVKVIVTSNSDSETNLAAELKEDNAQKEIFVQGIMTSNSNSETNLTAQLKEDKAQKEIFAQGIKASNSNSETNVTVEQKEENTQNKIFVQSVMTSNSDSETNLTAEQKEDNLLKEIFVQGVMTSNSYSETNLTAEKKEDNSLKEIFVQGVMTSNSDSETNFTAEQKKDNFEIEGIVKEVVTYSRSGSAGILNFDCNILKRTYDISEHLKMSIQSLIKTLDEYDEA